MVQKLTDDAVAAVSGGLRNVDKLEEYIREQKRLGKELYDIYWVVLTQPGCYEYLYLIHDENGKIIGCEGAGDLYEYTTEYYNSLP